MKILKNKTYKKLIQDLEYYQNKYNAAVKENLNYLEQQIQIEKLLKSHREAKNGK